MKFTSPASAGRVLAKGYDALARLPLTTLAIFTALQTVFLFNARSLWYSDEVRYAAAYRNMAQAGHWLVLQLNGQPYPDKPPVYFWLIALMDKLFPGVGDAHFFIAAAVSGLLFVWAGYALSRACGLGKRSGLGTGLILLSTLFVVAVLHYSRMDLLFSACIVASWACLARDGRSPKPTPWPIAALALAGLATLIKGPLGLIFPALAAAGFWLWRGQPKRLVTRAMGLGAAAALSLILVWLIGAWAYEGETFLRVVFVQQIFERATNTFHHKEGPFYYFLTLPAAFLPWTLALGGLSWRRCRTLPPALTRSRHAPAAVGRTFLWIAWVSAFVLLSLLSGKVFIYILPLLAPLAAITAAGIAGLEDDDQEAAPQRTTAAERAACRARIFTGVAGCWGLLGLAIPILPQALPLPVQPQGLWITGPMLLAAAALVFTLRRAPGRAVLLVMVLAMTFWIQPAGGLTAPSLDPVLSPRHQARLLGEYARQGYTPVAYDIYSGIFTYYAGTNILELPGNLSILEQILHEHRRVALVMKKKHFLAWKNHPKSLRVMDEQWIADQPYLLLVQELPKPAANAPDIPPILEL